MLHQDERSALLPLIADEPNQSARIGYQAFTITSTIVAPFYSYFLYQSIMDFIESFLLEVDLEDIEAIKICLMLAAIFLASNNLIADLLSVNPIEEAQLLLNRNSEYAESTIDRTYYLNSDTIRSISHGLQKINTGLSIPTFINFGAADAIAMAYLTSIQGLRITGGAISDLLGVAYYHMFSNKRIKEHSDEFIRRFFAHESSFLLACKSPSKSLAVAIEALSNMNYRAIAAAYIASETAYSVFKLPTNSKIVLPWMVIAGALTFYITAFSRVMQVHRSYFNPNVTNLTFEFLPWRGLSKGETLLNLALATLRGASAGWLLDRFIPASAALRLGVAVSIGLGLSAHNFYTLQQKQRDDLSLESLNSSNESLSLFDQITKLQETPFVKKQISFINNNARAARWLAFVSFLISLQKTLSQNKINLPLSFWDNVAIGVLWGTPTLVADGKVYYQEMLSNLAYYKAKYQIGKPLGSSYALHGFFLPKDRYPEQQLAQVLAVSQQNPSIQL